MKILNREAEVEIGEAIMNALDDLGYTVNEDIPGAVNAIKRLIASLAEPMQALDEVIEILEEED